MRRLVLSLSLMAGLAAPFAALAEGAPASTAKPPAAPATAAKPGEEDPNRVICTREHVVGSNRPKKVCRTVAQREALHDATVRTIDEGRLTPGAVPAAPGGL